MAIAISPLDLLLDTENPRFVILQSREQADIRKYLVTYEDVCQLATDINTYGRLYTCASHVRTQGQELLISNLPLPPFPVANAAQM